MNTRKNISQNNDRISRRGFLKASTAVGAAAAVLGGLWQSPRAQLQDATALALNEPPPDELDQLTGSTSVEAQNYTLVGARDFPLVPWDAWSPLMSGEKALARSMRDCGFNVTFSDLTGIKTARRSDLDVLVRHGDINAKQNLDLSVPEIRRRVRSVVERARHEAGRKGVYGYFLIDEPFPKQIRKLKPWVDAFRKADPDALIYINLFPATKEGIGYENYENYLAKYVRILDPEFISYDFYGLGQDGSLNPGYFWHLETVHKVAQNHGLPFWNTILSNAHGHYGEPSDAWLRFQLFTSLAYGARGLSWFTFKTPPGYNFRLAPIDPFGNMTPTWDSLRKVNLQLHQLAPVYLTLEHRHVFHYPTIPRLPDGLPSSPYSRIENSIWVEKVHKMDGYPEPSNVCFGEFADPNGEPYVMLVNTELQKSVYINASFKPRNKTVYWVNSYTGELEKVRTEKKLTDQNIPNIAEYFAPGQGMLLKIG